MERAAGVEPARPASGRWWPALIPGLPCFDRYLLVAPRIEPCCVGGVYRAHSASCLRISTAHSPSADTSPLVRMFAATRRDPSIAVVERPAHIGLRPREASADSRPLRGRVAMVLVRPSRIAVGESVVPEGFIYGCIRAFGSLPSVLHFIRQEPYPVGPWLPRRFPWQPSSKRYRLLVDASDPGHQDAYALGCSWALPAGRPDPRVALR
jgi:hypothetical protein